MSIGENIRDARKRAGLTQKQLGDRCGMHDSQLRRYESGQNIPNTQNLLKIASALDMNPADLACDFALDLGSDTIYRTSDPVLGSVAFSVPAGSPADLALSLTRRLTPEQLRQLSDVVFKLTAEGIAAVVDRVAELAEIPKYQQA